MIYLTESEKLAWDLYYSTRSLDRSPESAAQWADAMIEQRRLRYMPRHDDKPTK